MAMSARDWQKWYAAERVALGDAGIDRLFETAPHVSVPTHGALIFPHTRLSASGHLVAAVAQAVIASGREEVLALGVLHGARTRDAATVTAARAGDAQALTALRRLHGDAAPDDAGHWHEEFSLDGFAVLLARAAQAAGRQPPRLIARYPFLTATGDGRAASLPGFADCVAALARGAALVATCDPIHHGVGYRTPRNHCRSHDDPATIAWARSTIATGLRVLCAGDYTDWLAHCSAVGNDFRDVGPVVTALLGGTPTTQVNEVVLVNYADVLGSETPTWVAGAGIEINVTYGFGG